MEHLQAFEQKDGSLLNYAEGRLTGGGANQLAICIVQRAAMMTGITKLEVESERGTNERAVEAELIVKVINWL